MPTSTHTPIKSITHNAARVFLAIAQFASALGGAVIGVTQPAALSTLTGAPRQARADANPAGAGATQITGVVFQDFNSNGVMNTNGITPNLAIDSGVSGVVVSAYLSGSVSAATTASTDASGAYTLTGLTSGAQYRVEFTSLPQGYHPSFHGSSGNTSTPSNGTTVQFAAAGTSNVSLGINQPCDYCQANVQVASAFFRRSNEGAGEEAFTIYPIDGHGLITSTPYYLPTGNPANGSPAEAFRINGADQPRNRAYTVTLGALGSVYGVAYGRVDRRVFASAYFKRFAPIGPGGLGAIYEIDPDNAASVTEFADLNDVFGAETVGPDMHNFGPDPQSDFKTVSGYAITNTWDAAGKTGIGDIDLSDDGASMYVMNLYNRSVYVLPTNAGPLTSPAAAGLIQSTAVPTTGLYVPDSPGTCPAQDVRPFGLKYYLGKVYVTVVCSGESRPASGDVPSNLLSDGSYKMGTSSFTDGNGDSRFTWQDDKNLHAYVLRMDPATLAFEPTPVISFPLTFREAFGAGQMEMSFHSWSVIPRAYTQERYIFPQPILSDIEFERGNMVLAVRDRMGDQSAAQVYIMEGNGTAGQTSYPNGWADSRSYGQLLRACGRVDTGWTLENNGVCGGVTAAAPSMPWSLSTGPGGRRWYDDQSGDWSLHATTGSLAMFPGVSLLSTVYDPAGWTNQGMRWYDNNTGAIKQSYNYYQNVQPDYSGGSFVNFGKGVGMGDVELLCDPAPLQVGNRVWQDVNGNGIQDAGEPGIANVTVQLLGADGSTVLNTTSTASDGTYYFNLSAISATLANISGTQWMVRMDMSDSDLPAGYKVTDPNAGGATSNSETGDLADSDGDNAGALTQAAGYSAVTFTTQGAGTNNHTLDFGVEPLPPLASLRLAKQVLGGDSAATYPMNIEGPTGTFSVDLTAGTPVTLGNLPPGTYTVTEGTLPGAPAGYQWTGTHYDPAQTIALYQDQTGAVTITNMLGYTATAPSGVLTVTKAVANGGSSGPYSVTITGPNGYVNNTTITSGTNSFSGLAQGVYTITEDSPGAGWVVTYTVGAVSNTSNAVVTLTNAGPYAAFSVGTITGTVYNDYNNDGRMTANGVVTDTGVQSVTVTVYDVSGAIAGIASTDASGRYTVTVSGSGPYRVEFSALPADYAPSRIGTQNGGSVQFVTNASQAAGVNLALLRPCDYCQNNPTLLASQFGAGLASQSTSASLVSFPYSTTAANGINTNLASITQTGSIWGLAYDQNARRLYAASFLKRHVGLGDRGLGGVYVVNNPASVASFAGGFDLEGVMASNGGTVNLGSIDRSSNANFTLTGPNTATIDLNAFALIGKAGFGGIDLDADKQTLWLVNLNSRTLVSVDLTQVTPAPSGANPAPSSAVKHYAIVSGSSGAPLISGAPACTNGQLRPFALRIVNGIGYLGVICDASSSSTVEQPSELTAAVLSFDIANPTAFTTVVGPFALDYDREPYYQMANGTNGRDGNWQQWKDTWSDADNNANNFGGAGCCASFVSNPSPILSDIELLSDGSMALGFIDRFAHQSGWNNYKAISGTTTLIDGGSTGDILLARKTGSSYAIELGETDPGDPYALGTNGNNTALPNAGYSSVDSYGNGGEFFYGDAYKGFDASHHETALGGLSVLPGSAQVVATAFDPNAFYSQGVRWLSTVNGANARAYASRTSTGRSSFGKAGGMGDVELLCDPAPIEIGNRVWDDLDGDGVQGAGEPGLAGITLTLSGPDGVLTTTTDLNGNYVFTRSATSGAYSQTLRPETLYTITLITPAGYTLTVPNAGNVTSNHAISDVRDSDAYLTVGGQPTIFHVTGEIGQSNHGLDFGLARGAAGAATITNNAPLYDLGNRVWLDTNNNGVLDAGEQPVAGVAMQLRNSAGTAIASTTTDASGYYSFTNLPAGTYSVTVAANNFAAGGALAGYWSSTGASSDVTATGNNADHGVDPATYAAYLASGVSSGPVTLGAGLPTAEDSGAPVTPNGDAANNLTIDFGFYKLDVGNQVWYDTNNNGQIDGGEQPVSGVAVTLRDGANAVVSTTTTNASGFYTFTGLAAGVYAVEITAPAGYVSSGTDSVTALGADNEDDGVAQTGQTISSATFTLTAGSSGTSVASNSDGVTRNPAVDFGIYKLEVGNQVWYDTNNNGQIDGGEVGVSGIPVTLLDGSGNAVASTTTNAAGFYTFTGIAAGTYQVVITAPVGYFSSDVNSATALGADNEDDGLVQNGRVITSATFVLAAGSSGTSVASNSDGATRNPAVDFGLYTQLIGNTIWGDTNNNGVIDNGETPYAGTAITVSLVDNASGAVVDSIVTSSGLYTFTGVPSGTYVISITMPAGVVSSFPTTNTAGVDDNDNGSPSGAFIVSAPFAATPGTNTGAIVSNNGNGSTVNPAIDFGVFAPLVNLGNQVWFDTNNNGLIDGGEVGVNGVSVALYTAAGAYAGQTTTANGGWYTFTNLAEGGYYVVISPTNFASGGALESYISSDVTTADPNDNTDGDDNGYVSGSLVRSGVITLTVGNEPDTRTAANDANWSVDFGFYKLSVGNLVWEDVNNNGVYEPGLGELPRSGVSVAIVDANGAVVGTALTDLSGLYSFTGLISGTYVISITPPVGYRSSTGQVLTDGSDDNDHGAPSGATIVSAPFDLTPGAEPDTDNATGHSANPNLDFGLYAPLVNLGNQVWFDSNNNGLIDGGEIGVNGVSVALYTAAGAYAGATTTAGNGWYTFTALAEGGYYVVISPTNFAPGGALFNYNSSDTTVLDPNGNTDSDDNGYASSNLVRSGVITLTVDSEPSTSIAANDSNWTVDFGFYKLEVGNQVWYDTNNNGAIDGGEQVVAGIPVTLLDNSGNTLSTTTTNASGFYTFTGLAAGVYQIAITAPVGYLSSDVTSATALGADDVDDGVTQTGRVIASAQFTLTAGTSGTSVATDADGVTRNPAVDFGLYTQQVGNTIWVDVNNNGVIDGAETPYTGGPITVTLLDNSTGAVLSETVTTNGVYTFTGVPSGTHVVSISVPAGFVSSFPTTNTVGVDDDDSGSASGAFIVSAPFTATPGANTGVIVSSDADGSTVNPSIDFGIFVPVVNLGNQVWFDTNNNGLIDSGEAGVNGVTVALYTAADGYVSETVTGGDGWYTFTNLAEGGYYVVISPTNFAPGGALHDYVNSTPTTLDPNDNTDSDDNGYSSGNLVRSGVINLSVGSEPSTTTAANDSNWTVDFGFYRLSVGDLVWEDTNNNGLVDAGEPPLANVPVAILDGKGGVISTTLTDASGLYTFTGLISGTYAISITPPAGYVPSGMQETTDGGNNTNHGAPSGAVVVSAPFDLTPGAEPVVDTATASTANPNLDFGLWLPAALGNYVWRDYNRDGVQNEAPNSGVNGVTVTLYVSTTGSGWAPISSTVTANDPLGNPGYYTFTNLVSGTYQVVFNLNTLPAGATVTAQDTVTGTDALDSDADPLTGVTAPVTLFPGAVNPTIDMGVIMPAGLGDTVWLDVDHDGQQDAGEPPVQGVTVTLYLSGTPVSTTVTNGSGYYEFLLLTPGVPYSVSFTLPAGFTWTLPASGDSATDSNVDPVTGATGTVILQPGEFNPTIDAGIWTPPTASVTKTTLNPGTVRPQQQINYQIVVRNTGVTLAQNVVISDPVPAGTSYVAGSASPAATLTNGVIVWPAVSLMPGQAVTVTMSVTVNADLGGVTVITNVAQVDNVRREIDLASNQVNNPLDPTAVTLDAFSAQLGERGVTIAWRTTLERETLGFYVLRSMTGNGADAVRVNAALINAQGASGGSYALVDANGVANARYWIEEIELSGASVFYGPVLVATPGLDTGVTQQGAVVRLDVRPGGVAIVAAGVNGQTVLVGEAGVNGQSVVGGDVGVIEQRALPGDAGVGGQSALGGDVSVTEQSALPGEAGVGGQSVLGGDVSVTGQGALGGDVSVGGQSALGGDVSVTEQRALPGEVGVGGQSADTNRANASVANADTTRVDASITSADTTPAADTSRSLPWGAFAAGALLGLSVLGAGVFALRRKKRG